jgi:hypothetical protein
LAAGVAVNVAIVPGAYAPLQLWLVTGQFHPGPVIVPCPALVEVRLSFRSNVAWMLLSALMVTVHLFAATLSHPLQDPKLYPLAAVAVTVTTVPAAYAPSHVRVASGQLYPGPVIVPLPILVDVSLTLSNVAVMDLGPFIVTVQIRPDTLSHPTQLLSP